MRESLANERGSAMVLVLGILVLLAALAAIVVTVASSDRWSAFSEYSHSRAFYSADAASEAGLNWIRSQASPPPVVDADQNVLRTTSFTPLSGDHRYRANVQQVGKRFPKGWSVEYRNYEYVVRADGASAKQSSAAIDVMATKVYKVGY